MNHDAEFLVIGSGPAGVSAAFPLVEAGRTVLMIDGSGDSPWPVSRDEAAPWRQMLGEFVTFDGNADRSPKLDTPYAQRITATFRNDSGISAENFLAVGAVSRGGLSSIWGGFVAEYDDEDLRDWPLSAADMFVHYKNIVERIGVSGSSRDAQSAFYGGAGVLYIPPLVGPIASHVEARFRALLPDGVFALGMARNAVITQDHGGRLGCNLQQHCLWGCDRGAIYDSRFDLSRLLRRTNFRLQDNALAAGIEDAGGAWDVVLRDGSRLRARKIVLAAGCLASTQLALGVMPHAPQRIRLLSNPVMALPFLVPARLGKAVPARGHSLAQLGYRQSFGSSSDYVTGGLYEITSMPSWMFAARLPFSRRGCLALFPRLAEAMLIATCYFPGYLSDNQLTWTRSADRVRIFLQGGQSSMLPETASMVRSALQRSLRRCGAWLLPGAHIATPGTDVHYAGTLPMGGQDSNGTSSWGELKGAPGIHVVDGSVLPSITAKYPTLTIMANAARIGHHLVHG